MEIRLKEPLYLLCDGTEHVVRAGTIGVEKKKLIYFYDSTSKNAFGCPKQFCIENPQMFAVQRNLTDTEIPLRDVMKLAKEVLPENYADLFNDELQKSR